MTSPTEAQEREGADGVPEAHGPSDAVAMAQALNALEHAQCGLRWYRDRYPEAADGSDDEADEMIDAAVADLKLAINRADGVKGRELPELPQAVAHVHSNGEVCMERPVESNSVWPVELVTLKQAHDYARAYAAAGVEGGATDEGAKRG